VKLPFNLPLATGNEFKYIKDAVDSGHISGSGVFTKKCQELLENQLGVPKVLLTTSCTHALEMSAILLDIQPGDEIIVPSFTFVTSANAFVLRGARPVFIDISPKTLNLDVGQLEGLITPRTKAIVTVHYAGVACEMEEIIAIAQKYQIPIVEDNAHGLFGKYKGKYLGTFGSLATQSFHETKNISCGEGGALLINDVDLAERAEIIREKGTNRSRFFRGQVDKYTWVDIGSSYLPSDILAAFLYAQLENWEQIQTQRKKIWDFYNQELMFCQEYPIQLPSIPEYCEQSFHMFYLLLPTLDTRQALIEFLRERGIWSVFHYLPLHLSEMGKRFGGRVGDCPVTENTSDRLLRLPFYNGLSQNDQSYIVTAIKEYFRDFQN
jgi:dTDP-4-amino-4,6-dideoxygalactose transaminase